jgi:hypothetical protein
VLLYLTRRLMRSWYRSDKVLKLMIITDSQYSEEKGVLGFRFDTGATLFYGPGFLPGTDVPTYRFVLSRGFKDQTEYKEAQEKAQVYSKGLGFDSVHKHFESFQGSN